MVVAPSPKPIWATEVSGTLPPVAVGTRSVSKVASLPRAVSAICTRIGTCRSPEENLARLAEMSPSVAIRTVSAICATETPSARGLGQARHDADLRPVDRGGGDDIGQDRHALADLALDRQRRLLQRRRIIAGQQQREFPRPAAGAEAEAQVRLGGELRPASSRSHAFWSRLRSARGTSVATMVASRTSPPATSSGFTPVAADHGIDAGHLRLRAEQRRQPVGHGLGILQRRSGRQLDRQRGAGDVVVRQQAGREQAGQRGARRRRCRARPRWCGRGAGSTSPAAADSARITRPSRASSWPLSRIR